jgi:hypothetical protein
VAVADGAVRRLTNRRGPDGGGVPAPPRRVLAENPGDEHPDTNPKKPLRGFYQDRARAPQM